MEIMIKKLIEYKIDDKTGETIFVEVESNSESNHEGVTRISSDKQVEKSSLLFSQLVEKIGPTAKAFKNAVEDLDTSETSIEFGLNFSADAKIILVGLKGNHSLKVNLKWKNNKD